jgi:hypothetical protein
MTMRSIFATDSVKGSIRLRLAIFGIHLALVAGAVVPGVRSVFAETNRRSVETLVNRVRRADYEGNRPELRRLHDELKRFLTDQKLGKLVGYWRGYALWRRAQNGFNESVPRAELEADLLEAVDDFDGVIAKDNSFVEAKIANGSCLLTLVFLHFKDESGRLKYLNRAQPLLKEAQSADPDNPRLAWVLGSSRWAWPTDGSGQAAAMEIYQKALDAQKGIRIKKKDSLWPSWGEPELLMNLAWSNLHRKSPDLVSAEKFAKAALALVPYWHYVKDILIPQIAEAKGRAAQ